MDLEKLTTEALSNHSDLEKKLVQELLVGINNEDKTVPLAVEKELTKIEKLIEAIVPRMKTGGRLFYIGAGTSGRLGILDASECPPTYGVSSNLIVGIIAGGDFAIRNAVENAEDDDQQAWLDLQSYEIQKQDTVVGITASGRTPYVVGGLRDARKFGCLTGCVVCNLNSPVAAEAMLPIEVVVGPEFVTGSTRMKSGTAQKLVLNMISTTVMIQLGRVKGNKMVDMQLSNQKLVERGVRMVMDETNVTYEEAQLLLHREESVRNTIDFLKKQNK